jgi:hypothetical protein
LGKGGKGQLQLTTLFSKLLICLWEAYARGV